MSNDLGIDRSGNGNNWTVNNMTLAADQVVDSPTNNFATMNPLSSPTATATLSEGNLKASASSIVNTYATIGMSNSKWYWEAYCEDVGSAMLGIGNDPSATGDTGNYKYYVNGNKYDPSGASSYGASYTTGDIIAFTYDADIGTLTAYKNNVSQGTMFSSLSGTYFPFFRSAGGTPDIVYNFGQDSSFAGNKTAQGNQDSNSIGDFYYTPPTGFLALCTKNLPDVAVTPSEHFNTTLFTGDGTSNRDITGTGFNPDLNWLKMRSGADNHVVTDALRGTNHLHTNTTDADSDLSYPALITDGFRVSGGTYNNNSSTFVAWQWKANGSGSSNTNGSITSTVSANVDAGFSIVKWATPSSGTSTVGHGLSKAPELIIARVLEGDHWNVGSTPTGWGGRLLLNLTDAFNSSYSVGWNNTAPTSSVFSLGTKWTGSNNVIAYCFHSVDGYSKVGSYVGNGNADGTFIYTGFRPAFVICKMVTDAGEGWIMRDNARDPFNVVENHLNANQNYADSTASQVYADFLSNGFKQRASDSINNGSGKTYIYIAFAETPFKNSNAR
jgi:hypothetical protein